MTSFLRAVRDLAAANPALAASQNGASAVVGRGRKECDNARFKRSNQLKLCGRTASSHIRLRGGAGDELYDEGARVWSGAVHSRPAMVAFCKQPEDVEA